MSYKPKEEKMKIKGWKFWAVCALLLVASASILPNRANAEGIPRAHTTNWTMTYPQPRQIISGVVDVKVTYGADVDEPMARCIGLHGGFCGHLYVDGEVAATHGIVDQANRVITFTWDTTGLSGAVTIRAIDNTYRRFGLSTTDVRVKITP